MTLSEELLMIVLDFYPDWGHSPERFLEFIKVLAGLSAAHGHAKDLMGVEVSEAELAAVFIEVFKVDLNPYKNFEQLSNEANISFDLVAIFMRMRDQNQADDEFYDLVDEGGLQLSTETILEEGFTEYKSRTIVNLLRPHIHFLK